MKYQILHDLPGRLRVRSLEPFSRSEGAAIGALLETQQGIIKASASFRTGSILIFHDRDSRKLVLAALSMLDRDLYGDIDGEALASSRPGSAPSLGQSLFSMAAGVLFRASLPLAIRQGLTLIRSMPLLFRGLWALLGQRRLNVAVLDASAVGVSMLRRDFSTAAVIATLLGLGDLLEQWTHRKSRESLASSLILDVDKVWVRRDGADLEVPIGDLVIGDHVLVRSGTVIPVDGTVAAGDAMVNQASMTGESLAVHRQRGHSVYAGTAVEEGELEIEVTALAGDTRISRIVQLIDESESLKAQIQNRAEKMADAIVPYSFMLFGLVYCCTGNLLRASSALMVDYSCAIKLATPLAILSAMREGVKRGVLIKGGKFLEAIQSADTVVFDKTGTLTVSVPQVAKVIPTGGLSRENVLRTAACLEEHFPHSIARAVVRQAEQEGLRHEEEHSEVEYSIAHGIASRLHGLRVLVGSGHFIFEDEAVELPPQVQAIIDQEGQRYSLLYLAIGKRLEGILCIQDPLKPDAASVVAELKRTGIGQVIMLTGDSAKVAARVGQELGIDAVQAELLPAQKTQYVKDLRAKGAKVIMVGDGINDSPALAAADVGVSMKSGADIAQEVADVVLIQNDLAAILDARRLAIGVMAKIHRNYGFIVGFNSLLLALGLTGLISPSLSALLHNLGTVGSSLYSLRPILPREGALAKGGQRP